MRGPGSWGAYYYYRKRRSDVCARVDTQWGGRINSCECLDWNARKTGSVRFSQSIFLSIRNGTEMKRTWL